MRNLALSHVLFAILLWCASVFAFLGMTFLMFEASAEKLREERLETTLSKLQKEIQLEMDKGASLPLLKTSVKELASFKEKDTDILSLSIFETNFNKILFSTEKAKIARKAPVAWKEKCQKQDAFFIEQKKDKETIGIPLFNSFLENVGCLVSDVSLNSVQTFQTQAKKTAFRYTLRFCLIGSFLCFAFYLYSIFSQTHFASNKVKHLIFLCVCLLILAFSIPRSFSSLFSSFEKDLEESLAQKGSALTQIIKKDIEEAVQAGVSFKDIYAMDSYLNQIRQENTEVFFILLTDKTGRVLYKSGSPSEAFISDERTGQISLKDGYYNSAEAIYDNEEILGWIQIGINERFVRDEIL